ncbi:MAG: FecR family protein [Elusimicrobiota bacterium]
MYKKTILLVAIILFSSTSILMADEAFILKVSGDVKLFISKTGKWERAFPNIALQENDKVKTGIKSSAILILASGTKVTLSPESNLTVSQLTGDTVSVFLNPGKLNAGVKRKIFKRYFTVKTPTAVAAIRGTEFNVAVDEKGITEVEVFEGLLGVQKADGSGPEVFVAEGEKIKVLPDVPLDEKLKSEGGAEQKEIKREVGLDMSKEQVQAAAANELRLAEYLEGKTMIDVFGNRVRLEEYIMRPAADSFKFVVLNEREKRFDYFYYKGTFNKTLPTDLSTALKDLGGKLGDTSPEYYLKDYEGGFSNTVDKTQEIGKDGQLVSETLDATKAAETIVYNPVTDTFDTAKTGDKYWSTIFGNGSYKVNDVLKYSWAPKTGITTPQSLSDISYSYAGGLMLTTTENPSGSDKLYQRINVYYGDGTWQKFDNYIISDEGKIASTSDFANKTTGVDYKKELLKWNYEQVMTASEFKGPDKKIDLVVEPKILIKSGLIK